MAANNILRASPGRLSSTAMAFGRASGDNLIQKQGGSVSHLIANEFWIYTPALRSYKFGMVRKKMALKIGSFQ
jgi:hypothetical protein